MEHCCIIMVHYLTKYIIYIVPILINIVRKFNINISCWLDCNFRSSIWCHSRGLPKYFVILSWVMTKCFNHVFPNIQINSPVLWFRQIHWYSFRQYSKKRAGTELCQAQLKLEQVGHCVLHLIIVVTSL